MLSLSTTFVHKDLSKTIAKENDILIAFDGAPGRNAIGISGAYSSGIYKVKSNDKHKGLIYFELNSRHNQKIIQDYSQGTTILHASKAIPFLITTDDKKINCEFYTHLFLKIVDLKRKINVLKREKQLLLNKYFSTNQ